MPKFISYADAIIAIDLIAYIAPSDKADAIVITLREGSTISTPVRKADIPAEINRLYQRLACMAGH